MIADKKSRQILCTAFSVGKTHDFKLFKQSHTHIDPVIKCELDSGYLGIEKIHAKSEIPIKSSKKKPLTKEDKKKNRQLSSSRVAIENIIREVKIFRIIAERYRNRRKRFCLRFNLIAAIYNQNLSRK